MNDDRVVVLGGGLAGLTVAYSLAQMGAPCAVYEGEEAIGGLLRTERFQGFTADRLAHCFFTYNQSVIRLVRRVAGDRLTTVPRRSVLWRNGRQIPFSATPGQLVRFVGPAEMARVTGSYAAALLRGLVRRPTEATLADWVTARFGRRLYEKHLGPYVEKVWGLPGHRIAAEWGVRRITALSLADGLRQGLKRRRRLHLKFCAYPRGGIQGFAEDLAAAVSAAGVPVHTGKRVTAIHHANGAVAAIGFADGTSVEASRVVSTLPPGDALRLLDPAAPDKIVAAAGGLRYRDVVSVQVGLSIPRVTDAIVLYAPDPGVSFTRLQEPRNWDAGLAPAGATSVNLEVYCDRDEYPASALEALGASCVDQIAAMGFARRSDVTATRIVRTNDATPVYDIGFGRRRNRVLDHLARIDGLTLIGRTAAFSYRNMDEVMEEAVQAAPLVVQGKPYCPV